MSDLRSAIDTVVDAHGFSGVVRVDCGDEIVVNAAWGFADRAYGVVNTPETVFGIASGTKGVTALVVVSLVAENVLRLSTTARSLLGDDLPLIADDVTVEDLLGHRSGIGDYLDEELNRPVNDHVLAVPVHELDSTGAYLKVLAGCPAKFARGTRFSYCNSGYVVLALLAERATGRPFRELVRQRICEPAGMAATDFLRSDELPRQAARGYLSPAGLRTNLFHLPLLGSGDGGLYSTAADIHRLWAAFFAERIVPAPWAAEMVRPRSVSSDGSMRYGLGFWLPPVGQAVILEGCDAGVSFRSARDPEADTTWTVISNTSDGVWPVARCIAGQFAASPRRRRSP